LRIGVTGIFASGKGTVCKMFEELGAVVLDTDIIAREIVEPGSLGLQAIVEKFGDSFLLADGTLKRREFANYVFSNEKRVEELNAITHPLILKIALERSNGDKIYMINTPLLFEAKFDEKMDKNIVVTVSREVAIQRGMKRDGLSSEEIKARLNFQISLKEKEKLADYIIDNSYTIENTKRQVRELWKILINNQK